MAAVLALTVAFAATEVAAWVAVRVARDAVWDAAVVRASIHWLIFDDDDDFDVCDASLAFLLFATDEEDDGGGGGGFDDGDELLLEEE